MPEIRDCMNFAKDGFYDQAILCFRMFKPGETHFLVALYGIANCHFFRKEYDKAEASYRSYLNYNPKHPFAWYYLGVTQFSMRKYSDAMNSFLSANEANNDYVHTHLMLTTCCLFTGELDSATVYFKKAIELSPEAVSSYLDTFEEAIVKPSSLEEQKKLEIHGQIEELKALLSFAK